MRGSARVTWIAHSVDAARCGLRPEALARRVGWEEPNARRERRVAAAGGPGARSVGGRRGVRGAGRAGAAVRGAATWGAGRAMAGAGRATGAGRAMAAGAGRGGGAARAA